MEQKHDLQEIWVETVVGLGNSWIQACVTNPVATKKTNDDVHRKVWGRQLPGMLATGKLCYFGHVMKEIRRHSREGHSHRNNQRWKKQRKTSTIMDEGHLGMAKAASHSARSRLVEGECSSCRQTLQWQIRHHQSVRTIAWQTVSLHLTCMVLALSGKAFIVSIPSVWTLHITEYLLNFSPLLGIF